MIRRPDRVFTSRSFTGLAYLILKAGIVHYPGQWDSLMRSLPANLPETTY